MNENILFEAIGYMDDALVEERIRMKQGFDAFRRAARVSRVRKLSLISACAALVLAVGMCFPFVANLISEWRGNAGNHGFNSGESIGTMDTDSQQVQPPQVESQTFPPDDSWPDFVLPDKSPYDMPNGGSNEVYVPFWLFLGHYYDRYGAGYLRVKYSNMISEELCYEERTNNAYYLIEYELLENYYGTGGKDYLTVVFHIENTEREKQTKEVLNFIKSTETCIIHSGRINESEHLNDNNGNKQLYNEVLHTYLYFDSFYPIVDGRIILSEMERLENEDIKGSPYYNEFTYGTFSSYHSQMEPRCGFVLNGMPLNLFERNIRLYRDWSKEYYRWDNRN